MKKPPFVRSPYNYDTNEAGDQSGLDTGTEGGAKQSFKEECDINTIVKRFGLGYEIPESFKTPEYGDYPTLTLHEAMNYVAKARENFEMLPANIRAEFRNDPALFHDFALNPDNRGRLAKMGLLSQEALERDRIAQERFNEPDPADTIPPGKKRRAGLDDEKPSPRSQENS